MTSCYLLEFSVEAGSACHAEGHAYSDLGAIDQRLERRFGMTSASGADGYHVGLVRMVAKPGEEECVVDPADELVLLPQFCTA